MAEMRPMDTTPPIPPTTTTIPPTTTTVPASSGTGAIPTNTQVAQDVAALLTDPRFASLFTNEMRLSALGVPGTRVVDKTDPSRVLRYEGFQAVDPRTGQQVPPKYYDGDNYELATYGPEKQAEIIVKLQKANYLTDRYKAGDPLTRPIAAMAALMAEANLTGQTWDTLLTFRQTNPVSAATGQLTTYRVTNPSDLRSLFRKAAQDTLGRADLPSEQVDRMVNAYQQSERSYQQKAALGGTVTQAPSASTFAQERIEQRNPDEAQAYKFAQYAQVFEKLLG